MNFAPPLRYVRPADWALEPRRRLGLNRFFQFVDTPEAAFAKLQESLIRDHLQFPPQAKRHQPEIATTRR